MPLAFLLDLESTVPTETNTHDHKLLILKEKQKNMRKIIWFFLFMRKTFFMKTDHALVPKMIFVPEK